MNKIEYLVMLMLFVGFILSCSESNIITEDELKVINVVLEDTYKNLEFEVEGMIHPSLMSSIWYGGDFSGDIEKHLKEVRESNEIVFNMNKRKQVYLNNVSSIYRNDYFKPVLKEFPSRLPRFGSKNKMFIQFSVIGFSNNKEDCVIKVSFGSSRLNGGNLIYYLQKDSSGEYIIVVEVSSIGIS